VRLSGRIVPEERRLFSGGGQKEKWQFQRKKDHYLFYFIRIIISFAIRNNRNESYI